MKLPTPVDIIIRRAEKIFMALSPATQNPEPPQARKIRLPHISQLLLQAAKALVRRGVPGSTQRHQVLKLGFKV